MPGLRISHGQLLELCRSAGAVVFFGTDGGYDLASVHGLIFRPIPEGAYPSDWPDWRLDLTYSVAQQRADTLAADAEPARKLSGGNACVPCQAQALAALLTSRTQQRPTEGAPSALEVLRGCPHLDQSNIESGGSG